MPGSGHHRLGSIVASFIRGSLSLDLDESALMAVERSVAMLDEARPFTELDESAHIAIDRSLELADRTRPSDLVCA